MEFARQARNDRITLILLPERAHRVPTLWTEVPVDSLAEARRILARRERTGPEWIGAWERDVGPLPAAVPPGRARGGSVATPAVCASGIARWAEDRGFDAAVWTALPPVFGGETGRVPTPDEVVEHLADLRGPVRAVAEEYIRNAPLQIRTPYRAVIEEALGWTPLDRS